MLEADVKDGPVVLEVPPGVLGPVDDAYFRFVTDMGVTGPDKGKGGRYLLLHSDYDGEIPDGYFVARTPTYRNLVFFRALAKDGDFQGTAAAVKSRARSYPLSMAENPPEQRFVNLSGMKMNTIHANDFHFFEELNAVIQYEPADAFDPEIIGVFASIGIKKGSAFRTGRANEEASHRGGCHWQRCCPGNCLPAKEAGRVLLRGSPVELTLCRDESRVYR